MKRAVLMVALFLVTAFVFAQDATNNGNTSIAMLNYLATETWSINTTKNNRLMLDDVERFRISTLQRERLQYILEKQKALAIAEAMPNPLYLLGLAGFKSIMISSSLSGTIGSVAGNISGSIARSFAETVKRTMTSPMKLLAAASLMTLDSVLRYKGAVDSADIEFLKDNWELEDNESATLHNLSSQSLRYTIDIARTNKLGLLDTLNEESIDNFVKDNLDEKIERRKQSLETNRMLYTKYAPYCLELAKVYYDLESYKECNRTI
jgi:hypothetical protein